MAKYGVNAVIDGVSCGLTMSGHANGYYICIFERERASLENIENINWNNPVITDKEKNCILPAGYGYELETINYSSITECFTVEIKVLTQYLGDVADYSHQVAELKSRVSELQESINDMNNQIIQRDQTIESLTVENKSLTDTNKSLTATNETLIATNKTLTAKNDSLNEQLMSVSKMMENSKEIESVDKTKE